MRPETLHFRLGQFKCAQRRSPIRTGHDRSNSALEGLLVRLPRLALVYRTLRSIDRDRSVEPLLGRPADRLSRLEVRLNGVPVTAPMLFAAVTH